MVDKKISDACYPKSVKMGKEMRDGTFSTERNSRERNGN